MRYLVATLVSLLFALSSFAAERVIQIVDCKATLNGAKSISFEFTLKFNGPSEKMKNRLIDGKYLSFSQVKSTFMDSDLLFDDELQEISKPTDEFLTPLATREFKLSGSETTQTAPVWDVVASPELKFRRTYTIDGAKFRKVAEAYFKHEIVNGQPSWGGRLHRMDVGTGQSGHQDQHSVAALVAGDAVYQIVRWAICRSSRAVAAATAGKDSDVPDLFSQPDLYFIVDVLFKDDIGMTYRVVFQTKSIPLPKDSGIVDQSKGDGSYEENGVKTAPGFQDLSKR